MTTGRADPASSDAEPGAVAPGAGPDAAALGAEYGDVLAGLEHAAVAPGTRLDAPGAGVGAGAEVAPRRFSGVVVALVAALALALGALGGALALSSARTPVTAGEGSVEAGFARDMQAHHAQAVELAVLVRDRSDDAELRTVALDILLTQQNQIGQMASWLRAWGLPAASTAAPMAWMARGHAGHDAESGADASSGYAAMPGWVAPADMERLRAATGVEADRAFLELMIAHHRGGVEMARYAAEHARVSQVVELADGIVTTQERETTTLEAMLAVRS